MKSFAKNYKKLFFHLKFWKDDYYNIVYSTSVCEFDKTKAISKCEILEYGGKCKKCKGEHILTTDRRHCFKKPLPPSNPAFKIPNCYKFKSKKYEKCLVCQEGYMLVKN